MRGNYAIVYSHARKFPVFAKMATSLDPESVSQDCDIATRVFRDCLVDLMEGIQVGIN